MGSRRVECNGEESWKTSAANGTVTRRGKISGRDLEGIQDPISHHLSRLIRFRTCLCDILPRSSKDVLWDLAFVYPTLLLRVAKSAGHPCGPPRFHHEQQPDILTLTSECTSHFRAQNCYDDCGKGSKQDPPSKTSRSTLPRCLNHFNTALLTFLHTSCTRVLF